MNFNIDSYNSEWYANLPLAVNGGHTKPLIIDSLHIVCYELPDKRKIFTMDGMKLFNGNRNQTVYLEGFLEKETSVRLSFLFRRKVKFRHITARSTWSSTENLSIGYPSQTLLRVAETIIEQITVTGHSIRQKQIFQCFSKLLYRAKREGIDHLIDSALTCSSA